MTTLKIQIGICDDEKIILEQLERIVSLCLEEMELDYHLVCVTNGQDIADAAENLDIVFLDIAMPKMDGIVTGKKIQTMNKACKIIIASSMVERFKETYHINAFRFITKPYQREEIGEAISAAIKQGAGMEPVELYRERKKYGISQRKIKYIMAYDGYVEIKAGNYIFRKETSLNEMEKFLDKRIFFRIHKQYIINMLWVSEYRDNAVYIEGKEFVIARRKKSEFNNRYMDFDINYR